MMSLTIRIRTSCNFVEVQCGGGRGFYTCVQLFILCYITVRSQWVGGSGGLGVRIELEGPCVAVFVFFF